MKFNYPDIIFINSFVAMFFLTTFAVMGAMGFSNDYYLNGGHSFVILNLPYLILGLSFLMMLGLLYNFLKAIKMKTQLNKQGGNKNKWKNKKNSQLK